MVFQMSMIAETYKDKENSYSQRLIRNNSFLSLFKMLNLPIHERIFLCISLLLFVFGLTELGILADLNRIYYSVPDEAKSNSGVAITVAGVLAIAIGLLCMLYAGILTQEKWIKPRPSDPQVSWSFYSYGLLN